MPNIRIITSVIGRAQRGIGGASALPGLYKTTPRSGGGGGGSPDRIDHRGGVDAVIVFRHTNIEALSSRYFSNPMNDVFLISFPGRQQSCLEYLRFHSQERIHSLVLSINAKHRKL